MNIRYRLNERAGRCPMCLRPSERKIWTFLCFGLFYGALFSRFAQFVQYIKFYASSDQFHSDLCPVMTCSAPEVEKEKKETDKLQLGLLQAQSQITKKTKQKMTNQSGLSSLALSTSWGPSMFFQRTTAPVPAKTTANTGPL